MKSQVFYNNLNIFSIHGFGAEILVPKGYTNYEVFLRFLIKRIVNIISNCGFDN